MNKVDMFKRQNPFKEEHDGIVLSNKDPMKAGRVLIKIEGLTPDEGVWASSKAPNYGIKLFFPPVEGSKVRVRFRHEDIHTAEYFGGLQILNDHEDFYDESGTPTSWGMQDANGNSIIIDSSSNDMTLIAGNNLTLKANKVIVDAVAEFEKAVTMKTTLVVVSTATLTGKVFLSHTHTTTTSGYPTSGVN
jgi:hypothetical protein